MTIDYYKDSTIRSKVNEDIRSYCLRNKILFEESNLDYWTKYFLTIMYSIGGYPSQEIIDRMLPEYLRSSMEYDAVYRKD